MTPARFVWANLRRRQVHVALALITVTLAFMVYGLALGLVEGFRRAALQEGVTVPATHLPVAIGVAALGMTIILLLTMSAMSHLVRSRAHELAVMMAIGFTRGRLLALLAAEMAVPCIAGAMLGLLGTQSMFAALVHALPALAVVPAPVYSTTMVLVALVLASLIAILSTAIPLARLARKHVALLMRGETAAPAPVRARVVADRAHDVAPRAASPRAASHSGTATRVLLMRQILIATRIGMSTLPMRARGALLIVASVAAVVFLLLLPLAAVEGIRVRILGSGDAARVVLRSSSAVLLDNSRVPESVVALIAQTPGIARSASDAPLLESEVFTWPDWVVKRNDGKYGHTMLVGVGALWHEMTPEFRLLSGRLPRPGQREVLAGELAALKFSSLDAGTVEHARMQWRVVGTFATGGWWDGYLVGSAADLNAVASRSKGSAVRVRLSSPEAFDAFRSAVQPLLPPSIIVERETDYYASLWGRVPKHMLYVVFMLGALISAGAAFGTALVMHDTLEDRRREIATLRILGFDARSVAAAVLIETLSLAMIGSLLGVASVWLWLDGDLYNGAWNVFRVVVDLPLLCFALTWGAGIALGGTMPLVLGTLRQSALDAMRDLFVMLRPGAKRHHFRPIAARDDAIRAFTLARQCHEQREARSRPADDAAHAAAH